MSSAARSAAPDQAQRNRALDPARSILVQAPAGSGKTDLLTRRFLRLLGEVESPGEIVAITFTRAAAAEMRHRILAELEKAAEQESAAFADAEMAALACAALARSRALGWNLTDLPSQLRISTIDSFCRDLALQQPLVSGLGGGLDVTEQPNDLYLRAARRTLEQIDAAGPELGAAIESLLLWRDNNWQELESLLVAMLARRDRWMHGFVLERDPDWEALRASLERPFANAVRAHLTLLSQLLDHLPHARQEALALARFACKQSDGALHGELAELADFPLAPFADAEALEEARAACECLADLLLTNTGGVRKRVDKSIGFPADRKQEKARLLQLIADLEAAAGFESALAAVRDLPPSHYTEDEWRIVRACFTLLRRAAGELKVVFAQAGAVDFVEVAQIALNVLRAEDNQPSDAAIAVADGIRHLLVDEFQDTSRRQHRLLAQIVAAWSGTDSRTCFVVGDPMQSIYFFRDAEAELFARIRDYGLEIPSGDNPLCFDHAPLAANFRSAPGLVTDLNSFFAPVFAQSDGSGMAFTPAQAAREGEADEAAHFNLHLNFAPQSAQTKPDQSVETDEREAARAAEAEEIVSLIRAHTDAMEQARARGQKYRIAVLARTHAALARIAEALREASIRFRAVDLEELRDRPEVLDVLALARALLNPEDRVAWLGVLRAPWCGLSLSDLHAVASGDEPGLLARPVPDLLAERRHLLSEQGQLAAACVLAAFGEARTLRTTQPTATLGTWLEQIWLRLGGEACVDATARANLDLLWSCLDRLPGGAQDLSGPALGAALEKLKAQPDPETESDCGVQLMTIHRSKGLEFEVVMVPELQAATRKHSFGMLSWLERGLAEPDESGEIAEFLIAPFQPKGAERSSAKAWVDDAIRAREQQEMRRILYVAATRAREELHFFARPAYKTEPDGSLTLVEPRNSLLATAWPALADTVRARFEEWKAGAGKQEIALDSIAATDAGNVLTMPRQPRPTRLRRLPPDYPHASIRAHSPEATEQPIEGIGAGALYARHEGGLLSRALGAAVHSLLEELARLRTANEWPEARAALKQRESRAAAEVRALGLAPAQAAGIAAQALQFALAASSDPVGAWILSPHAGAASEARWTGTIDGSLRSVRVDRVFRAGPSPRSDGEECWWIVDYKTAHADGLDPAAALPELRRLFAPQLEAYARVLRNLHGADAAIRAGLYYPRMGQFDWWATE